MASSMGAGFSLHDFFFSNRRVATANNDRRLVLLSTVAFVSLAFAPISKLTSKFYRYWSTPATKDKDNLRFPPSTTQGNRAPILDFSIALKNDLETVLTLLDNMATGLDSTYKEDTTNTGRIDMYPENTLENFDENSKYRFQDIHPVENQEENNFDKGPSTEDMMFFHLIPALEKDGDFDMGLTNSELEYVSHHMQNMIPTHPSLVTKVTNSEPYLRALLKYKPAT